MKWALVIMLIIARSEGGRAIDHIPMETEELCKIAAAQVEARSRPKMGNWEKEHNLSEIRTECIQVKQ